MLLDKSCQAEIFNNGINYKGNTFICNRFIFENGINNAETQTSIQQVLQITTMDKKQSKNVSCCTDTKKFIDSSTLTDSTNIDKQRLKVLKALQTMSSYWI